MIFQNLSGWKSRLSQAVLISVRTATKRSSGGKSANKNTAGRRLGPKKGEGEYVIPGQIIWRQRGTAWYPGENAGIGRDHTIFAKEPGFVRYYRDPFHPKRRIIGIALGKEDRLPTDHFEPRRRRFGYRPIDNDEVAEFEREYMTRKETIRQEARQTLQEQRDEARDKRVAAHVEFLKSHVPELSAESAQAQGERLDVVYQYLCGGFSATEATKVVTGHIIDDFKTDAKVGRITADELKLNLEQFEKDVSLVDSKVKFGASHQLTAAASLEAETKARNEIIAQIIEVATPYLTGSEGTPQKVSEQIVDLLKSPLFSAAAVAGLKRKYLRKPTPVLATAELEKKAKKGHGELQKVWDYENRSVKTYYVPKNAKQVFN